MSNHGIDLADHVFLLVGCQQPTIHAYCLRPLGKTLIRTGKASGQFDNPDWTVDDVQPYVNFALEQFGPERVMFGSDWPVCILGGSYSSVWANTQALLAGLSDAEKDAVLGGNAIEFYNIP